MTQEDKELLLKDLCARLPHEVICEDEYGNVLELNGIDKPNSITFKCSSNTFWTTDLDKCKPYLRPISSITEEEEREVNRLLSEVYDFTFRMEELLEPIQMQNEIPFNYIDWLNKNNFDYRGLIPKGLAIEVTEENNPYKCNKV